ncbi:MAG: tail fiber domain-containing protein [Chitinophagales bacterium]
MKNIYFLLSFLLLAQLISAQNVGIGVPSPLEKLHIDGSLRGNQSGAVRISTGNGYVDIGPKNGSWSHFETDRTRFYFNEGITVDGGLIGSHSGDDLSLQTNGTTRISVLNSNGNVGIGLASPLYKFQIAGGSDVRSNIVTDGYAEDVSGIIQGNYVPSHSWSIGTGSVGVFSQNGATSENERVWHEGPHGNRVIAWLGKGTDNNGDGGWNSQTFPIDHTKTYRVSVWIKKVGGTGGNTYLGCLGSDLNHLNGTSESNPYFWSGDLPELDKWYLIVGYIHGSGDPSTTSYGGIYDSKTGEKVISTTDFKFATSATQQRHRSYLYYNSSAGHEQYFWDPRFEEVNGKEPSISALLGVSTSGGENYIKNQFASDQNADFRISGQGRVASDFTVAGNTYAQDRLYVGTGGGYFYNDAGSRVRINQDFYTNNSNTYLYGDNTYLGDASGDNVHLRGNQFSWTSGGGGIINTSGNVGIGTTGPSQKLDVNGQVRIRGGSPAEGKVLRAIDGTGVATWEKEGRGEYNEGSVSAGNWYRIAYNPGNRANAEFTLRDYISGGGHSTLKFIAGISYGNDGNMSFTVLSHSKYGTTPTFSQVRIMRNGTYDNMYLEVYISRTGSVDYSIVNNLQSSGWIPVDWTAGSIPSGYTVRTFDVNNLFVVGDYQNRFTVKRGGNAELAGRFKSNGINETSDIRFKQNINALENSLDKVKQLRGVNYYWKVDEFPDKGFSKGKEIGVIAQEVEEIFPELVSIDDHGYKSVQYSHLVPVLIEAIKEQQALIENQKQEMESMAQALCGQETKTDDLETRLNYLEEMLLQTAKK